MALEFMLREDAQETFLKFFEDNEPSDRDRCFVRTVSIPASQDW